MKTKITAISVEEIVDILDDVEIYIVKQDYINKKLKTEIKELKESNKYLKKLLGKKKEE